MLDLALRQNRFIMGIGGQKRVAGNVARLHQTDHTGQGQRGAGIDATQQTVRDGRCHRRRIQGALELGDVVDIRGCALHLGAGTFMGRGAAADAGLQGLHASSPKAESSRLRRL